MNKRIVAVVLFTLAFVLSACKNEQGSISNLEHEESNQGDITREPEHVTDTDKRDENEEKEIKKLTEKEVMKAFKAEMPYGFLYESILIEADESYTYALIVKKDNAKVIASNTISFYKNDTELLFIAVDNETGVLSYIFDAAKNMEKDYYLRQAGLILVDEKAYLLLIHQMNYNKWERFGLDTFVLIDSEMKHVYGETEGSNLYNYWFTHKAELCSDGTIEISKRTEEFELYQKYIHKSNQFSDYPLNPSKNKLTFAIDNSWEKEYKGGLYEFVNGQTWSDISEISLDNRAEVDILLKMKQCELIQEEMGIQASECAVLFKEDMGTLCLFVVKAKNDYFPWEGIQNLIFLLYDKEKDDFISMRSQFGDFSDAYLFQGDNGIYLAYYTVTVDTGIPTSSGGVLNLQNDSFIKIWPSESDGESFFAAKVAELTEDGRYLLYKVESEVINNESIEFYLDLDSEEIISVPDIIKAEEEKPNVDF